MSTPDPRPGLDEKGHFTPAFSGQRPPFLPKHGCYSRLKLGARAAEIAGDLREVVPIASPSYDAAVVCSEKPR